MLPKHQRPATLGILLGIGLYLIGFSINTATGTTVGDPLQVSALPALVFGGYHIAKGKGHHPAWAVLGSA